MAMRMEGPGRSGGAERECMKHNLRQAAAAEQASKAGETMGRREPVSPMSVAHETANNATAVVGVAEVNNGMLARLLRVLGRAER